MDVGIKEATAEAAWFAPEACALLLAVMREREPCLHTHGEGVRELAAELAWRYGVCASDVDVIARAAELHDIGKIAIPDEILNKPGPLDPEEWALMREHTVIGERMLASSTALRPAAPLVRWSHERWDGRGYPDGLAGTRIPVGARIIAICDSYEAMTEQRSYSEPVRPAEAFLELRRCAGSQFDPKLVEIFLDIVVDRIQADRPRTSRECVPA